MADFIDIVYNLMTTFAYNVLTKGGILRIMASEKNNIEVFRNSAYTLTFTTQSILPNPYHRLKFPDWTNSN